MSPTMIDAIVIVILVLSTMFAWSRGFVREFFSLMAWVISVVVAANFAYMLVPTIEGIDAISSVVDSCEIYTAISFVIIFIVTIVIMALITPFFSDMIKNSRIGLFNSALGGFFGFLRGLIIVMLVFIVYDTILAASFGNMGVEESRSYLIFKSPTDNIAQAMPENSKFNEWFYNQLDFVTRKCGDS